MVLEEWVALHFLFRLVVAVLWTGLVFSVFGEGGRINCDDMNFLVIAPIFDEPFDMGGDLLPGWVVGDVAVVGGVA